MIVLAAVFCLSLGLLRFLPDALLGSQGIAALVVYLMFVIGLCVASVFSSAGCGYRPVLLFLWWVLLASEEFFNRWNTSESTFEGNLQPEAYAEAIVWLAVLGALAVLAIRDRTLTRELFKTPQRWLTAFALLCAVSTAWSVDPSFSLVWSAKLATTVLLLAFCSASMTHDNVLPFLRTTLFAYAFLVIAPVVRVLFGDGPLFVDGRLGNVSPTGLSLAGGNLFLLALLFRDVAGARYGTPLAFIGLAIMILAGGKTAIVAGITCAILYYFLRRRVGAAAGILVGAVCVGAVIASVTPLASYLHEYSQTENAATLTGRTGLWETALPSIAEAPVLGHGHAASKFISVQMSDVQWDAGHMHNGFLEAMYNNGIPGLVLLVIIHVVLIRNLIRALRWNTRGSVFHTIAAGCFALYLNLFINGMFNAVFGGRTNAPFMLLMALLVISSRLPTGRRVKMRQRLLVHQTAL